MQPSTAWRGLAAGVLAGMLLGCRAESTNDGRGEKVTTPFGGVQIRTNEAAAENGIGVPVYPGATLVKKNEGKDQDNGSADINLSFGSMRLRVKVLSYRTDDAPEAVRSYYRKELGRFGTVITCVDDRPVGEPTRTPEGLTCDKGKDDHVAANTHGETGAYELKAGSEQHQHTVSIEKDGSGSKFALVLVDLPKSFTLGDEDDGKRQTQ